MTAMGSPLYDVADGHVGALLLVLAVPLLGWIIATAAASRDAGRSRLRRMLDGYQALPLTSRAIVWLLLMSAAAHAGLAADAGHAGSGLRTAFLVQVALLVVAVARMALGRSWRGLAVAVLLGSLVAYWAASLGGEAPDQLGIAIKLVEIGALALIIRPIPGRRVRSWSAAGLIVALVVLTDVAAWASAGLAAGGADALASVASHETGDDGHGAVPAPGMLMTIPLDLEPTEGERAAAQTLYDAVVRGIAPFADPAVAGAAGYDVAGIGGRDFHAGNAAYEGDGRTLDSERPETLVYAEAPDGRQVLVGAMFLMDGIGETGPTVGGPLTIWHGHEHVCVALLPPSITAILSPLGSCPVGSFDLPLTTEMIHVWTVPGAPQPFGDLDEAWLIDYLAAPDE